MAMALGLCPWPIGMSMMTIFIQWPTQALHFIACTNYKYTTSAYQLMEFPVSETQWKRAVFRERIEEFGRPVLLTCRVRVSLERVTNDGKGRVLVMEVLARGTNRSCDQVSEADEERRLKTAGR